jgi:hypothetical protein
MNRVLRLKPAFSLSSMMVRGEIVAFAIGPDSVTYATIAMRRLDHSSVELRKPSPSEPLAGTTHDYRVIGITGSSLSLDVEIRGERFDIHHVQPLPDELLLVSSRAALRGPDDHDQNGRIYSRSGEFKSGILLGDGVSSVQTTPKGRIWTGYFDEGIYGNFGWNTPIGASGLVAWDTQGRKTFEFESKGAPAIDDCYALNVAGEDDVWLYYYSDFPLVRLRNDRIASVWKMPIHGCSAFAIADRHALFFVRLGHICLVQLFNLRDHETPECLASFELRDQSDQPLDVTHVAARADVLRFISGGSLFAIDTQTVIDAAK